MANKRSVKLHPSWLQVLGDEFEKPYMEQLRAFLASEKIQKKIIYPETSRWFAAFDTTPFDAVKVVIIGQDPYHGPGQAHGLCFSVPQGVSIPPSLQNIYKELQDDLAVSVPQHGCLTRWAEQGVLLLNATLTVEHSKAGSHQNRGWETFTDCVISALNEQRDNLVFILWGSYAQRKGGSIDRSRHLVLQAPHPSPLAAYRGFFGSKPFSKTNDYLVAHRKSPISW